MIQMLFRLLSVIVLMPIASAPPMHGSAAGVQKLPGAIWETSLQSNVFEYEYQTAAVGKDSTLWVVVGLRPRGQLSGPQAFSLFSLDANGKTIAEVKLVSSDINQSGSLAKVCCLTSLKNGDLLLLGSSQSLEPLALILDTKTEKPVLVKRMFEAKGDRSLSRMLSTHSQTFSVIGRSGRDGSIVTIDSSANVLGETLYGKEGVSIFLDGVESQNKDLALVGASRTGDIWVGKVNSAGDVLYASHFQGHNASIAPSYDGNYEALFEEETGNKVDVWERNLTPELKESRKSKILENAGGLPFKITSLPGGNAIVAGSNHNLLWVSRIDVAGQPLWTYTEPFDTKTQPFVRTIDLIHSQEDLFVAQTMLMLVGPETKLEQRQIVVITRLSGR